MATATRRGDFGLCSDRLAPVADGVCARLRRLAGRLSHALEMQRRNEVDREIGRLLAQSGGRLTDSLGPAAVAGGIPALHRPPNSE
jgi:hypothetical protein